MRGMLFNSTGDTKDLAHLSDCGRQWTISFSIIMPLYIFNIDTLLAVNNHTMSVIRNNLIPQTEANDATVYKFRLPPSLA